jgi:hypothetical protein
MGVGELDRLAAGAAPKDRSVMLTRQLGLARRWAGLW